jgi:hypothetical protein
MPVAQILSYPRVSLMLGKPSAKRNSYSLWSLGVLVSHGVPGQQSAAGLSDLQHRPGDSAAHVPQQATCMLGTKALDHLPLHASTDPLTQTIIGGGATPTGARLSVSIAAPGGITALPNADLVGGPSGRLAWQGAGGSWGAQGQADPG